MLDLKFDFFLNPLNVWSDIISQSTVLSELALFNRIGNPLSAVGGDDVGRGNLFWMLWISLFSVRSWTHHAPFTTPSSQNGITERTRVAVIHCDNSDKLCRCFYYTWFERHFIHLGQIHSKPPSPLPVETCASVCEMMFALPMLCKLSWCITRVQLE